MQFDISLLNQIFQPDFIAKTVILTFLALYIAFALIIFKQVKSLNVIVKAGTGSAILELIIIINLFIAISLFIYALAIL